MKSMELNRTRIPNKRGLLAIFVVPSGFPFNPAVLHHELISIMTASFYDILLRRLDFPDNNLPIVRSACEEAASRRKCNTLYRAVYS